MRTLFKSFRWNCEFSGTYFDISDFTYRAEQMAAGPGRLMAIKQLQVRPGDQAAAGTESAASGSPVLGASITLYAFEIAPAAAATTTTTQGSSQPSSSPGAAPGGTVPTTNPSGL